ncbi:MAG: epoxyqueuosine reductase QueH [Lachnospiraceae bacterium]|nr:epoxyqueuosine reductase QueH [Lachnospiraceae bacterium]
MNKPDYQRQLDNIILDHRSRSEVPRVLLHSCCAPCSSYCVEYLSEDFLVTVFYYNPNIYPDEEYLHRVREQERFLSEFPTKHPVGFIEGDFEKKRFYDEVARGLENEPERGRRCEKCFELRLSETAKRAVAEGFDYFCTTLTISPQKDPVLLNTIGKRLGEEYGVAFLPSEFRKREGYKRSTEISREYGMYRQNYCGCVYSMSRNTEEKNA